MSTYTILTGEGYLVDSGLSLRDAAHEILTSDGRSYEIRRGMPRADSPLGDFVLWSFERARLEMWQETKFFSLKKLRDQAEAEIFAAVVNAERFPGHNEAITDEQYAQMAEQGAEDTQEGEG